MEIKFSKENYTIEQAFDELESIFSDKQVNLLDDQGKQYTFQIEFPNCSDWYVDPYINQLSTKDLNQLPIEFCMQNLNDKFFLQTHFHYNALRAAEEYDIFNEKKIDCIIHFDDHSDMMPIYKKNGNNSYESRIKNGELSIGNFITHYLLHNSIDIFHVQNAFSFSFTKNQIKYSINKTEATVGNLIFSKFEVYEDNKSKKTYQKTDLSNLFIPNSYENIWLDIDLDYFCNRFNRDSDWREINYLNMDLEEVKNNMREFLEYLQSEEWIKNVKVLTIASSPGFFPYEYLNEIEFCFLKNLKQVIHFDCI